MATHTPSDRIDTLFDQEKWVAARRLIERNLAKLAPDAWIRHWWLARLSTTYYEEHDYGTALEFARQAHAIAPDCPLVLWDLAGTLDMLGDKFAAIETYQKILSRGVESLAADQCGEGEEWAAGLLTDSWYRMGLCFTSLGQARETANCAEQVRSRLNQGWGGIYTREEMVDLLDAR